MQMVNNKIHDEYYQYSHMAMNSLYIGIHRLTYDSVTSYMYMYI